jgi:hypothetical protein
VLHREVYERTPQFEERVSGARLRTYEWQFLASLDGQATVGELVRRLKIDEATISEFIVEQERNGAIAPRLLSFEEFLHSSEAEAPSEMRREPEPPPRASTASQLKRTATEELRAIARLSIAAAIGEILSLISKRRATSGSPPASPARPATPAPSTSYDVQNFAAAVAPEVIAPAAPAPPAAAAPPREAPREPLSELRYDRDDLASFKVFDWTLPAAPPQPEPAAGLETSAPPVSDAASNGVPLHEVEPLFDRDFEAADIEYLQAFADEPVVFEDGLTIADRLLRDYGPIDATEAAPSTDFAPYVEPAAYTEPTAYTEPAPYADPASATDGAAYTFEPSEPPEPHSLTAEPQSFTVEHQSFMSEFVAPVAEPPPYSPMYPPPSIEAPPAHAEDTIELERDPQRVTFSVNDLAGYVERVEPPLANGYQLEQERVEEAPFLSDPYAAASPEAAAAVEQPAPAAEHTDPIDPSITDPIVFSLSARNPDSFWSGKK